MTASPTTPRTAPTVAGGEDLTDDMLGALFTLAGVRGTRSWYGPRPGSNLWPMLEAECEAGDVPGEMLDRLERGGLLAARPCRQGESVNPIPADPDGDHPEIDLDHVWWITAAGREAIGLTGGFGHA